MVKEGSFLFWGPRRRSADASPDEQPTWSTHIRGGLGQEVLLYWSTNATLMPEISL